MPFARTDPVSVLNVCHTQLFIFAQIEGVVKEGLPSAMFRVEVGATGKVVLCTISGRIRKNFVRILVGDPVRVELSPYDLTRGRITFRYK